MIIDGSKCTYHCLLFETLVTLSLHFHMFQDKYRQEYLKMVADTQEPTAYHAFISKQEEVWCAFHNLFPAALNNISEICKSFQLVIKNDEMNVVLGVTLTVCIF